MQFLLTLHLHHYYHHRGFWGTPLLIT